MTWLFFFRASPHQSTTDTFLSFLSLTWHFLLFFFSYFSCCRVSLSLVCSSFDISVGGSIPAVTLRSRFFFFFFQFVKEKREKSEGKPDAGSFIICWCCSFVSISFPFFFCPSLYTEREPTRVGSITLCCVESDPASLVPFFLPLHTHTQTK